MITEPAAASESDRTRSVSGHGLVFECECGYEFGPLEAKAERDGYGPNDQWYVCPECGSDDTRRKE